MRKIGRVMAIVCGVTSIVATNAKAMDLSLDAAVDKILAESQDLKKADANVIIACDGEEAVQAFENCAIGSVDVILMDIMMPVTDGLMAAEKIRSLCRADAKSVPIIAMTANAFDEDKKLAFEAGMNGFVAKPINIDALIRTLADILKE